MVRLFGDPVVAWVTSLTATLVGFVSHVEIIAAAPSILLAAASLFFFIRKKLQEERLRKWLFEETQRKAAEGKVNLEKLLLQVLEEEENIEEEREGGEIVKPK